MQDFKADDKNFYYALGSIKNVGYDAISNIVVEREKTVNSNRSVILSIE